MCAYMNRRQFLKLTLAVPITVIVARLPEKPLEGEAALLNGCWFLQSRVDRTQAEFERDFLGTFEGVDWAQPGGDKTWAVVLHPDYAALTETSAPDFHPDWFWDMNDLPIPPRRGMIAVAPSLAGG